MDTDIDTDIEILRQICDGILVPTAEEALRLSRKFPECIVASAAALDAAPDGNTPADEELRLFLAARLSDYGTAEKFLGGASDSFDKFYPDPRNDSHSTDEAIDTFLGCFSQTDPAVESAQIEKQLFGESSPTGDYAAMMLRADTPAGAESLSSLARSLSADAPQPEPEPVRAEEAPMPAETPKPAALSLSLAYMMIKNHNYRQDLEIIQEISLNNQEKSI